MTMIGSVDLEVDKRARPSPSQEQVRVAVAMLATVPDADSVIVPLAPH